MSCEFISEVDRKFLDNNLLTKEDWEDGGIGDFTDLFDVNEDIKLLTNELPDELISFSNDSPPLGDAVLDWKDLNGECFENGLLGDEVKTEPLSPISSSCSETGSEGYGSASDLGPCVQQLPMEVKSEEPQSTCVAQYSPIVPHSTTIDSNCVYTIVPKQEDNLQTVVFNNINNVMKPVPGSTINLNNIMNSKIKIQPKPSDSASVKTVKIPSTTISPSTPQPRPLVLTSEEFSKLTSSGTLRFQPSNCTTVAMDTSETSVPLSTSCDLKDIKSVKRQQRMIKNRESASLSRKRKKEYLLTLEAQLDNYNSENQKLKQENDTLKKKLCVLQNENERLKQIHGLTSNKKTTTCLLAILVMLSINLAPWSLFGQERLPSAGVNPIHKGRQLMSISEEGAVPNEKSDWSHSSQILMRQLHKITEEMSGNGNHSETLMCPTYFNKTESMLLAEKLAGWMIRHEEEKQKTQLKKDRKKEKTKKVKKLQAALRGDVKSFQLAQRTEDSTYHVQLFKGAENYRQEFLNAIHRRNDTFYVLSFHQDYFLVPATAHNKTMRPRMSLVMPAMALNETMQPPPGSIGMMQIDCEVVNTQLIHVRKSVIPPNMNRNSSYSAHSSHNDFP